MSQPPNLVSKSMSHSVTSSGEKRHGLCQVAAADFGDGLFCQTLCVTMARPLSGLSLVNGDDSVLLCH